MGTSPFSVRLDDETRTRLENAASREDRSASHVIQRALEQYLDNQDFFYQEMRKADAELDKGVFISREKVRAWMESWDTESELPEPQPDVFPESHR